MFDENGLGVVGQDSRLERADATVRQQTETAVPSAEQYPGSSTTLLNIATIW